MLASLCLLCDILFLLQGIIKISLLCSVTVPSASLSTVLNFECRSVSRLFKGCFKDVSRLFHVSFKGVSRKNELILEWKEFKKKKVSRTFYDYFK